MRASSAKNYIFDYLRKRELSPRPIETDLPLKQIEKRACEIMEELNSFLNTFTLSNRQKLMQSTNLTNNNPKSIGLINELKKLALLGSTNAQNYFISIPQRNPGLFQFPNEIASFVTTTLKDIGMQGNPEFLLQVYFIQIQQVLNGVSCSIPNICLAFECLQAAAKMKGNAATKANLILAYFYAEELTDPHQLDDKNDNQTLGLYSLTALYSKFALKLNTFSQDENNVKQAKMLGTTAFAKLGCEKALESLIYLGNLEKGIKEILQKVEEFEGKLKNLKNFLSSQFNLYFQQALESSLIYGYTNFEFNNFTYDLDFLIKWKSKIEKLNYSLARMAYDNYKQQFIDAVTAENNENSIAATCLVEFALNNSQIEEAMFWLHRVANSKYAPAQIVISSIRRLCNINENTGIIGIKELKTLLEKAANLGCADSAIELFQLNLQENNFACAKIFFEKAIKNLSPESAQEIIDKLIDVMMPYRVATENFEPLVEQLYLAAIKFSYAFIQTNIIPIAQQTNNAALVTAWKQLISLKDKGEIIPDEKLIKLVHDTVKKEKELIEAMPTAEQENSEDENSFIVCRF